MTHATNEQMAEVMGWTLERHLWQTNTQPQPPNTGHGSLDCAYCYAGANRNVDPATLYHDEDCPITKVRQALAAKEDRG